MKPTWILLIALCLLAGCVSEGAPSTASTPASATSAAAAAPDADTGAVLVIVTDPELVAVQGAQVELVGTEFRGATDAAGQATFNGLVPTTYTVLVAKPGYTAQQDKGKLVDVKAGETSEVKMVLNPVVLVDATNSYHNTFPFRGFMSCGLEGAPGTGIGRNTACGHYLNPGGVQLGDPNHRTRFLWPLDSPQITGVVVDAKWTPATGATGTQLRLVVTHKIECAATCLWQDTVLNVGGPSPVHGVLLQGDEGKITKKFGTDPKTYPKNGYFETGAYCQTNCQGAQVVFQQSFDKWLTAFYGVEPPADFNALPK